MLLCTPYTGASLFRVISQNAMCITRTVILLSMLSLLLPDLRATKSVAENLKINGEENAKRIPAPQPTPHGTAPASAG